MNSFTIVGNLVSDPELRFVPSGSAVANFTIAHTPRIFNKQTNEWTEGEALFMDCSVWRQYAENVAESLQKGLRVIVTGKLTSRSFEGKDGTKQTRYQIDVDEVGPALRYATAKVTRTSTGQGQTRTQQPRQQQPAADPWANTQPAAQADPWGQPSAIPQDQPPF